MAAYRMFPPVGPDRADELAAGDRLVDTDVKIPFVIWVMSLWRGAAGSRSSPDVPGV